MVALFPTVRSDPELYPYRSGLLFGFFNALVWQIAIGTPMVLFAERLGASSLQVGLAYSFVFLLTPLQVLATALLPRYGIKRLTMRGWAARSLFLVCPLGLALLAPDGCLAANKREPPDVEVDRPGKPRGRHPGQRRQGPD